MGGASSEDAEACGGGVGIIRGLAYKLFKCVWRETGWADTGCCAVDFW